MWCYNKSGWCYTLAFAHYGKMSVRARGVSVCSLVAVLLLLPKQSDCSCIHGDVRLVGGLGDYEGNVQVCISGKWGYVCSNGWGSSEAQVVCRQLSYFAIDAISNRGSYYGYGNGTTRIWMDYVRCTGSEVKLLDCPADRIPNSCDDRNIAGVVCLFGRKDCMNGDIRLENTGFGYAYGRSEGKVKVCSNNEWGTVCDNGWDSNDATVACKQLGYTGYMNYYTNSHYGSGLGYIWLTDLACNTSHTSLFDCPHSTDITGCTHSYDAGVKCYSIDSSNCTHGDVKLWSAYESTPDDEGIPLVCKNGTWYPMYDGSSCDSLRLACKAAGYSGLKYYGSGLRYGYYYQIHYEFSCSSNSNYNVLWNCPYLSYPYSSYYDRSVGVKCYTMNSTISGHCSVEGSVRLADGEAPNEGRIEYCYHNEWAPMCNIDNDNNFRYTAGLICKELGYSPNASQIFADNRFGRSHIGSSFSHLSCFSSFTSLSQCGIHTNPDQSSCGMPWNCYIHYGLRCYDLSSDPECTDGDVRLVDGIIEQEGRPEVCVNGLWSQICGDWWAYNSAPLIMCKNLGYTSGTSVKNSAYEFGSGYGPIVWSNVACNHYINIFDCYKVVYPNFYCDNSNIAGVRCVEDCSNGDVRLVGGASANEGTVEICYDKLWGLISDDRWSDNEAIVVCRQLGYNGNDTDFKSVVGSYYGKPKKPIHLKDVTCSSSNYTNILNCFSDKVSLSDGKTLLPTTDVAGVTCQPTTISQSCLFTSGVPCTRGSVRLTQNGEDSNEVGMVEYCNGAYWTPLCSIDNRVAAVICRELGHTSYSWGSLLLYGVNQAATSLVQNITCNGDEGAVSDCSVILSYNECQNCSDPHTIGLRCFDTNTLCDEGSVRLVNGSSDNEGRVEVCVNGAWGSVCDSDWDTIDGLIVCQQLGYTGQVNYCLEPTVYHNSHYGDGSFPVVYSNVNCKGWEDSISDCVKDDYLSYTCHPEHTAGLRCNGDLITTVTPNPTTSDNGHVITTADLAASDAGHHQIASDTGHVITTPDLAASDTGHLITTADLAASDTGHLITTADRIASNTGHLITTTDLTASGNDGLRSTTPFLDVSSIPTSDRKNSSSDSIVGLIVVTTLLGCALVIVTVAFILALSYLRRQKSVTADITIADVNNGTKFAKSSNVSASVNENDTLPLMVPMDNDNY